MFARSFGRIRHQNSWTFAKSFLSGLIFSPFFNESNTKTISKALQVTQSVANDSKPDFRPHHDLFVALFGINFWSELVATWLQQSIGPWWAYIKKVHLGIPWSALLAQSKNLANKFQSFQLSSLNAMGEESKLYFKNWNPNLSWFPRLYNVLIESFAHARWKGQ